MKEILCNTLVEFLDQIDSRRSRELHLHDNPLRRMLGFEDTDRAEGVLVRLVAVKDGSGDLPSLMKVSARLGYSADQVVRLLQTQEGRAQLLRT